MKQYIKDGIGTLVFLLAMSLVGAVLEKILG
jgi:archaellin